jgi:hypothetical protein
MSSARATKRSTARSKSPDMTKGETPGLRQIVQNRFLKDVFESAAGTFFRPCVVCDRQGKVASFCGLLVPLI